jgi:hypothetical protein
MPTPQQLASTFRTALSQLLKSFAQKAPHIFHAYIERHFDEGGQQDDASLTWRRSDKLAARTGRLTRSFIPNQPGSLFRVTIGDGGLFIQLGTSVPYAGVNEGTKGEKVFIASKGRMHKMFFARYMATGNPFFRTLALSVKKRGGVTIPKRPYFSEAVRQFHEREIALLASDIFATLKQSFGLA